MLDSAQILDTFLFETLSVGLDTHSLDGRARLSKLAMPHIQRLPDGVFRQLILQALAERTGLELASLKQYHATPTEPPVSAAAQASAPDQPGATVEPQRPPKRRVAIGNSTQAYPNIAQAAIALLLHQPSAATLVPTRDVELLAALEGDDIALLCELIELLHKRPDSNTAMLLGHWYGTPAGDLLNRLAGQERLIPSAGIEQQFQDTVATLSQVPQRSELAAHVDKLRATDYSTMTEQEKRRLKELLLRKQQLDIERKGG